MSSVHLHLLLNHFPMIGLLISIALLTYALVGKKDQLKQAGFGVIVVMALLAIPTFLTGEPAEEAVEGMAGISKALIEQHEAAALPAFVAMELAGTVALLGLVLSRRVQGIARWSGAAVLALALLTAALMARTANLGGQIHHPEIRSGQTVDGGERNHDTKEKKDEDH